MSDQEKQFDPIQGEIVHEYDGILEADNRLPMWWLWTFYGAIIFSIGYWFYYEEFESAPGLSAQYLEDKLALAAKTGRDPTDGELAALAQSPAKVQGQQTFLTLCSPCHEPQGQGKIGPNLTDNRWVHGGAPLDIYRTIRDGVPEKGMPAWGATLGPLGAQQVAAFVISIRDTNVAGKAAEGEPYDPGAAQAQAAPAAAGSEQAAPSSQGAVTPTPTGSQPGPAVAGAEAH